YRSVWQLMKKITPTSVFSIQVGTITQGEFIKLSKNRSLYIELALDWWPQVRVFFVLLDLLPEMVRCSCLVPVSWHERAKAMLSMRILAQSQDFRIWIATESWITTRMW